MAVSTHSQDALVAGGGKDNDGGVIANGGTIAGSKYTTKLLTDINIGRDESGSKVVATAGSASRPGIQAAFVSGGTLAYNPNARAVTRSSSDTGFLIRGGSFTKLSGKASTEHFLSRPGSDNTSRRGGNIHDRQDSRQLGTWATQIFDIFGGGLLQSDGTAKAGITGRGSDSNFIDPLTAGGATQSVDSAVTSKTTAGEFIILTNFTDYTTGDVSGAGAGSSNLMNYSSITG